MSFRWDNRVVSMGALAAVALVTTGCMTRPQIARRDVQKLYDQANVQVKVHGCHFVPDLWGKYGGTFQCEIETPHCSRLFTFYVPRAEPPAGQYGAPDLPAEPLHKGPVIHHPCAVPTEPEVHS